MKTIITTLSLLFCLCLYSQAPQGISYQAVAFDTSGSVISDSNIGLRISILENSVSGNEIYSETHVPQTNDQGLFSINIGQGTPQSSSFEQISWGGSNKFIKVEIDPNGGTNYNIVGTNQLMSVPYALYAENVNTSNGSFFRNLQSDRSSNFIAYDFVNEIVQVFNSELGSFSSQQINSLSSDGFVGENGNFAFYDFFDDIVYAYHSSSNSWTPQNVNSVGNAYILASQDNFVFYDFSDDLIYAFQGSSQTWFSLSVGGAESGDFLASNGNFFIHDFVNDQVAVFDGSTGTWVSQSVSSVSNSSVVGANGSFSFYDFVDEILYVYSKSTGSWVSQSMSSIDSDQITPSGF